MSLYFKSQDPLVLIGTKNPTTKALTGWALTSAYQTEGAVKPTKSFSSSGYSRALLNVSYTMGAAETANSLQLKVEQSTDNVNWVNIANDSTSLGVSTLTAREFTFVGADAATATISIIMDIGYKFMRVSAKETGVVTNAGTIYVEALMSGL